jgi:hypothetical protein
MQNLFRPAIFLRINQGLPKSSQEMRLRIELCAAFEQFARLIGLAQLPPQFRQAQESPKVGLFRQHTFVNDGDLEPHFVETPLRTVILI